MLATTADAQHYWANHPATPALVAQYAASGADPHREWALAAIEDLPGAHTVLDLGCHCGPLLARLTDAGYEAAGIDINASAVAAAVAAGYTATIGAIPIALGRFAPQTFDVAVSSFCLAYIAPADLVATLAAVLRVVRLGLVIVEPMAGPGVVPAVIEYAPYVHWRHDYMEALVAAADRLYRPAQVSISRRRKEPHEDLNGVVVATVRWA